jgi:hypothetical protein
MANCCGPGPLCSTKDGFDTGTLARSQSPMQGPVCSLRIGDMITEAIARGAYAAPKTKARHGTSHSGTIPSETSTKKDPAIELLNLSDVAKKAAYELKKKHPFVVFTSGRRDKTDQARAMASNVTEDDRDWISETYAENTASKACQKWVDNHPQAKTQAENSEGLKGVLDGLTDAQLGQLSRHLSGNAFDVQPTKKGATRIKDTMRGLVHKARMHGSKHAKFLDKEGGKIRWHIQF